MFELVKDLYFKRGINRDKKFTDGDLVILFSLLARDVRIKEIIKDHLKYLFFVEPEYIYISLYCNIPFKRYLPQFGKTNKEEIEIDKALLELAKVFDWSKKELIRYKSILEKVIDKKEILQTLGVK